MRGYQKVVAANGFTTAFQVASNLSVVLIGWHLQREHVDHREQCFQLFHQACGTAAVGAVAKLGRYDHADRNASRPESGYAPGHFTARVPNKLRYDVGIK